MSDNLPSEILLVIAMHRSGSSALTRCLNLVGYNTPKTLIEKTKFNVMGHWESKPLARLNDAYLLDSGLQWYNWHRGSLDSVKAATEKKFKSNLISLLENEFTAGEPAVVKEPRLCRLVPTYKQTFEQAGIPHCAVTIFRNPLEVMESLGRRNQMARKDAALLWLRYVTEAVLGAEGIKRIFVSYEELLSKPLTVLRRIEGQLPTKFPKNVNDVKDDIESFLNYDLQHHKSLGRDIQKDSLTKGWIYDVYKSLQALTKDPENAEALQTIKNVHAEFQTAAPMLEAVHTPNLKPKGQTHMPEAQSLKEEVQKYRMIANVRKEQIESLHNDYKDDIRHYEREIEDLARNAALNQEHGSLEPNLASISRHSETTRQLAAAETALKAKTDNLSALQSEVETVKANLDAMKNELASILAEKTRLEAQEKDLYQRLEDQHLSFANSTSWKITRPLRFVVRQFRPK